VGGLLTKPLVRLLQPIQKHWGSEMYSELTARKSLNLPLLINGGQEPEADTGANIRRPTSLRMLLSTPTHTVHFYWRKFDNAFMRPVFGGRGFVPHVPGSPTETVVVQ
jgi:sodium/hydrogen exchanger 8